jgi:hypothetical protein
MFKGYSHSSNFGAVQFFLRKLRHFYFLEGFLLPGVGK